MTVCRKKKKLPWHYMTYSCESLLPPCGFNWVFSVAGEIEKTPKQLSEKRILAHKEVVIFLL